MELCVTPLRYPQIHRVFRSNGGRIDHNRLTRCQAVPTASLRACSPSQLGAVLRGNSPSASGVRKCYSDDIFACRFASPGHLSCAQRPAIRLSLTGHQSCRATRRQRFSHATARSTTNRLGSTKKPLAAFLPRVITRRVDRGPPCILPLPAETKPESLSVDGSPQPPGRSSP